MTPLSKRLTPVCTLLAVTSLATQSLSGAGFILQEQSFSGLGVGFASGAAGLDDNSSMYFNPATLTRVPEQQVTTGIHFILPKAEFKNTGSLSGYNPAGGSAGVPTQGPNATSDKIAVVPNLFFSRPLNDTLTLGVGMSTPYGLATSYSDGWVGRYIALETDLLTLNTNVALAFEVSEMVSVGVGVSVCYADALLSNAINFGAIYLNYLNMGLIPANEQTLSLAQDVQANLGGTKYDGHIELTGDDIGYGFNFGLLFTPDESTRIGVHYRSNIKLAISGTADFTVGAMEPFFGSTFVDQGGSVDLNLPDTAQVSIHRYVNEDWAVMADIFHTWWSKFEELDIRFAGGVPDSLIPEKWENAWRYSVGTTYRLNEQVELRAGLVLDESPVPSATYRSPRIPDADRFWISIGAGYELSENFRLDLAYVHIFVDDPIIDNPTHSAGEFLKGTMDATVNILSIGGSYTF